jgi:hypothetical protein
MNLSNLTDEQFIKLIQIKDKTNGKLAFVGGQSVQPTSFGSPAKSGFTNILLGFSEQEGFKAAAEILVMLAT